MSIFIFTFSQTFKMKYESEEIELFPFESWKVYKVSFEEKKTILVFKGTFKTNEADCTE